MPGDDETVAAILTGAAHHAHLAETRTFSPDDLGHATAGVFHEHHARHPEGVDRGPVHGPHLGRGENQGHQRRAPMAIASRISRTARSRPTMTARATSP